MAKSTILLGACTGVLILIIVMLSYYFVAYLPESKVNNFGQEMDKYAPLIGAVFENYTNDKAQSSSNFFELVYHPNGEQVIEGTGTYTGSYRVLVTAHLPDKQALCCTWVGTIETYQGRSMCISPKGTEVIVNGQGYEVFVSSEGAKADAVKLMAMKIAQKLGMGDSGFYTSTCGT